MNRQQLKAEKDGKRLVKNYKPVADYAREKTIKDMCRGEFDTDYYRALAECFIDFQQGKISKERYEELIGVRMHERSAVIEGSVELEDLAEELIKMKR